MDSRNFVLKIFVDELQEVLKKKIGNNTSALDEYEKTLIYGYTKDGFEQLNKLLRNGGSNEYEVLLNAALGKLVDYQGLVYRGVDLEDKDIQVYIDALDKDLPVTEPAFVSSTKIKDLCFPYNTTNTLFRIMSKHGKEIEDISHYGVNYQNEREVLFKSKTKFDVINICELRVKCSCSHECSERLRACE